MGNDSSWFILSGDTFLAIQMGLMVTFKAGLRVRFESGFCTHGGSLVRGVFSQGGL